MASRYARSNLLVTASQLRCRTTNTNIIAGDEVGCKIFRYLDFAPPSILPPRSWKRSYASIPSRVRARIHQRQQVERQTIGTDEVSEDLFNKPGDTEEKSVAEEVEACLNELDDSVASTGIVSARLRPSRYMNVEESPLSASEEIEELAFDEASIDNVINLEDTIDDIEDADADSETMTMDEILSSPEFRKLKKSKKGKYFARATKEELDDKILYTEMTKADEKMLSGIVDEQWREMTNDEKEMYLNDVRYLKLDQFLRQNDKDDEADELLQCLYIHYEAQVKQQEERGVEELDIQSESEEIDVDQVEEEDDTPSAPRAHPLTIANQFETFPSAVTLPQNTLVGPVSAIISGTASSHLSDAAKRIFGGPGLPYSGSNPAFARSKPQKPIPLSPSTETMSEIEADAWFAAVMPHTYAGLVSVLTETRKRLGSDWLEGLFKKEGGPKILDANGGGAGVLAFREVLSAEWQRLKDDEKDNNNNDSEDIVDGEKNGDLPLGRATVLTSSHALRMRSSVLLDDTTFIPRLPDYIHATDQAIASQGKFDIILAPHSLWSISESHARKDYTNNLWSLLSSDSGVLILLEKGTPRGFEAIASARRLLLNKHISSPDDDKHNLDESKEMGMIIAPCTNHYKCPMYLKPGITPGRKNICSFRQRFIRPPYLQKLLGAKDKNHEDASFSYLSVIRGRDLRRVDDRGVLQGDVATDRAFTGYQNPVSLQTADKSVSENEHEEIFDPTAPIFSPSSQPTESVFSTTPPSSSPSTSEISLSLPRLILPPLKRTSHVHLDVCTPSGVIERWTVSKAYGKQAYRDARKSKWGDLWALGAKTRVDRSLTSSQDRKKPDGKDVTRDKSTKRSKIFSFSNPNEEEEMEDEKREDGNVKNVRMNRKAKRMFFKNVDKDDDEMQDMRDGKRRSSGQKISGIRDKRNKRTRIVV